MLVTQRDRAWVRPSIQMETTLFQLHGAVSNIASKCPGPETRVPLGLVTSRVVVTHRLEAGEQCARACRL